MVLASYLASTARIGVRAPEGSWIRRPYFVESHYLRIEFNGVGAMGTTLTVTAKGQITLRKELLNHLGVCPGDMLDIDLLPGGRLQLGRQRGTTAASVFGMLSRPGTPRQSIQELNQVAASGWADEE